MALEAVFTVLAKVGAYVVAPIGHQLGYVVHYNNNFENLKDQVAKLEDERHRLQGFVDSAMRNGEVIEQDVEKWLSSVERTMEETERLLNIEVQGQKRCLKGWCPDLRSRYRVGKKVKKMLRVVIDLHGNGKFNIVSHAAPPPENVFSLNSTYEAFESRVSVMKDIIEALKDDQISIIGIYGMAGVGKTILVKEVGRQAKDLQLFDTVVMATVSQTPSLKDIQGEIADMLGLKFVAESLLGRAGRLRERLLKGKRILVILDDVWARLDLEKVGIPSGCDHEGCKIILTSRSLDTCIEMDTQKDFFVDVLPEWEAWKLFKKMAGDYTDFPDMHPLAVEIAKECAGLPIAIVTVARALKNRCTFIWKDALQQLRKSTPANIKGMHSKVFSSLELSYNYLESEEAKTFFLLCSLFPEDSNIAIQVLLEYGLGLGLFQNFDTLEEARVRVLTIAHNLISSCLLLEGSNKKFVKMHDVVRDVALSIASKATHVFLVRVGGGLRRWPKKGAYEQCTAISINSDDIHELPDGVVCPKLQTLLLECTNPSLEISGTFFIGMKDLRVVDLSCMHIPSLPPSFCSLENLRTLRLDHCELNDISILKELKTLEILSFRGSDVQELPVEIRELTHLRLLDLTSCQNLKVIPPNVLASLRELEELYMLDTFEEWEVVGQDNRKESRKASMVELKDLSCLTALDIHIPNVALLPRDLLFKSLLRFKISIGGCFDERKEFLYSKTMKLENIEGASLERGIKVLLKKLEYLNIYNFKSLIDVIHDLNRDGFMQLKCLEIGSCYDLKYIVNTVECAPTSVLPALEWLKVTDMDNMNELCHGNLPMGSFSNLRKLWLAQLPALLTLWKGSDNFLCLHNLKIVRVNNCCKLEHLFSPSIARGLNQLHVLDIAFCGSLKEIVAKEKEGQEGAVDKIVFPQLRFLKLQHLYELTGFWPEGNDLASQDSLFEHKVAFPSLEELQVKKLITLKQIWHPQLLVESFCKLKTLRVSCCDKLLNAVPHESVPKLLNLEEVYVGECSSLTAVFDLQGLIVEDSHTLPLSSLKKLKLQSLPMLMHVWNRNPIGTIGIENLNFLEIHKCDSLRSLFTPSMAKGFLHLQYLCVESCETMEAIVVIEGEVDAMDEIVFPQVKHLKITYLPNLMSFYLGSSTLIWPCLEELSLVDCPKMKKFVYGLSSTEKLKTTEGNSGSLQESNLEDYSIQQCFFNEKVSFPNLKKLKLEGLQNTEIWHNQLQVESFCKLEVLLVDRSDKLQKLFTSNFLQRLQNLEQLTLSRCNSLEELFEVNELVINEGNGMLPQLKELRLWGLPKLMIRTIYEGPLQEGQLVIPKQSLFNGKRKVACCHLEVLRIEDLHNLNEIWHGPLEANAFSHLKYLAIRNCHKLQYIVPPNLLRKLYNLRKLVVENCSSLEEIVAGVSREEATIDKLVFPQLSILEFVRLPNLKCFCLGSFSLEYPSLNRVQVDGCPKMHAFSSGVLSTPMLEKVSVGKECDLWLGDLNKTMHHLFEMSISSERVRTGGTRGEDTHPPTSSSTPRRKHLTRAEKKAKYVASQGSDHGERAHAHGCGHGRGRSTIVTKECTPKEA